MVAEALLFWGHQVAGFDNEETEDGMRFQDKESQTSSSSLPAIRGRIAVSLGPRTPPFVFRLRRPESWTIAKVH